MTQRELRAIRLKNEYKIMQEMKSDVIDFMVNNSNVPDHYVVTLNIRTIIGVDEIGKPVYRDKSVVDIKIPPDYPEHMPMFQMREKPPFHPQWYDDGRWDIGSYHCDEPLWCYVRRMAKTMQFDARYINVHSPSNRAAVDFWRKNTNCFPTDTQEIPQIKKKVGYLSWK